MNSYTPQELSTRIASILSDKKGTDIEIIKVSEITTIADFFVICTGSSSTQVRAFADEVEFKLKQSGVLPDHIEGRDTRSWIVLDYQSVVVHIFDPEAREYYDLERLWADGEKLIIDHE